MDATEEIITKSGKVWLEDGIIRSKVLINGEYTLECAIDDGKAFRKLAEKIEGEKLLLVEPKNILKVSKKTRKYQAIEGPKIVDKIAQVIENPVTRTIISFFLGLPYFFMYSFIATENFIHLFMYGRMLYFPCEFIKSMVGFRPNFCHNSPISARSSSSGIFLYPETGIEGGFSSRPDASSALFQVPK